MRGTITGVGTFIGGILHTLPFLIPHYEVAIVAALIVVGLEMLGLAWIRWRFFGANYLSSLAWVCFAATVIVGISAALGTAA